MQCRLSQKYGIILFTNICLLIWECKVIVIKILQELFVYNPWFPWSRLNHVFLECAICILPYFGKRKQVTYHLNLNYWCFHIVPSVLFFQVKFYAWTLILDMLGKTSWYPIDVRGNDRYILLFLIQEMSLLSLASFCQSRAVFMLSNWNTTGAISYRCILLSPFHIQCFSVSYYFWLNNNKSKQVSFYIVNYGACNCFQAWSTILFFYILSITAKVSI